MTDIAAPSDGIAVLAANNVTIFGLEARNRDAQRVIVRYAKNHTMMDVGIGIIGTFVPGGGLAGLIASVAVQGPLFYKPMSRELAAIYLGDANDTERLTNTAWVAGGALDIAAQFGAEFFAEIAGEIVAELGAGAAVSAVPVIGGLVGAALDATLAATLTWTVGTMISMYYQNGGNWIGSRHETYELARKTVGKMSPRAEDRVKLDDIATNNSEILDRQFQTLRTTLLDAVLALTKDESAVMALLQQRGIPKSLIDLAVPYIKHKLAA